MTAISGSIAWYRPSSSSAQYNDEVDGALFSAQTYRDFVLPYERQLAEFYGGVSYYHSCGTMTKLFPDLLTLPNFYRLHVSQSSDLASAVALGGWGKIEHSLDPLSGRAGGQPGACGASPWPISPR